MLVAAIRTTHYASHVLVNSHRPESEGTVGRIVNRMERGGSGGTVRSCSKVEHATSPLIVISSP
jgi:hypothetical protein